MQYNAVYGSEDQRCGEKGVLDGDDEYSYVEPQDVWKPKAPQLPPPRNPPPAERYVEIIE